MNQRIAEYILQSPLGSGSFGQVWLAHHHIWTDRLAAVKLPTDPQYIRQLQREGLTLHTLNHPNIVQPIGFDPYADPPYLIMEYVPGINLRTLMQGPSLTLEQTQAILRQVLTALCFAHARGVIHRDIKPENILIHEDATKNGYEKPGMVKLTDFGLGQSQNLPAGSILHTLSLDVPQSARIAGTIDYMAPETRQNPPILDARADLYACGVILHEMLTGKRPVGLEVPSDLNPHVPRRLDAIFRKAYARLENRYASAEEFLLALNAADGSVGRPMQRPPPLTHRAKACPQCGASVSAQDQYCLHCGRQLVEHVLRCPQCGAYPDPNDLYCILCGAALEVRPSAGIAK